MNDLTPIIEFCVDMKNFFNVDLTHRGYYQIRSCIRTPAKYGQIVSEIHIQRSVAPSFFPAAVVDGQAVGKTIEVLYAEESIKLDDSIDFTVHLPHRLDKLANSCLQFVLALELWFIEKERIISNDMVSGRDNSGQKMDSWQVHSGFRCLSRRDLLLKFRFDQGLHCFRPVLFDYYHLAAVTVKIHASLIGVEMKSKQSPQRKLSSTGKEKLADCRRVILQTLLSAYDSLQNRIRSYIDLFPSQYQIKLQVVDVEDKLKILCQQMTLGSVDMFEETYELLSTQLTALFHQFLQLFRSFSQVDRSLAIEHHHGRIKRFSEGFFSMEDTMHTLISHGFTSSSQCQGLQGRLVDMLKKSAYFSGVPDLAVECRDTDTTMAIIFEQRYLPFSPFNVKSPLCLDFNNLNKPSFCADDTHLATNQCTQLAEERRNSQISTSLSHAESLDQPIYPMDIVAMTKRRSTEPNLVIEREYETDFVDTAGGLERAHSEKTINGVTLTLSANAVVPVIDRPTQGHTTLLQQAPFRLSQATKAVQHGNVSTDRAIRRNSKQNCLYAKKDSRAISVCLDEDLLEFVHNKELFKEKMYLAGYDGHLCSDSAQVASRQPYFFGWTSISDNKHLIVCVHGLDGTVDDLRPYTTYLKLGLASQNIVFLMSQSNQTNTFNDMTQMATNLVTELLSFIEKNCLRVEFIGHSLGTLVIRAALADRSLAHLRDKMHCFLSLNGPHCGLMYNQRAAHWGVSLIQWWKGSRSLQQLMMRDQPVANLRDTFLYQLSQNNSLALFKYVLLVGSYQDMYVPCHSALIQSCKEAQKDTSPFGSVYGEVVTNMIESIAASSKHTTLVRYTAYHGMANVSRTHQIMGRAAHIAVLDDDSFIEKLLTVSALRYFA